MDLTPPAILGSADPGLVLAWWLGAGVLVLALTMLAATLALRRIVDARERNRERAAMQWRRILLDHAEGLPSTIPALVPRDLAGFIEAWNSAHQSVSDPSNPGLQRVAREVGLDRYLYAAIDHGHPDERVMAIVALGFLRGRAHFERLAGYLNDRSTLVSLSAARALMQIDPGRAVHMLVPHIVARQDWPQAGVAQMLHESSPGPAARDIVSRELGSATMQATAHVAPRLLRCLSELDPAQAAPVVRHILDQQPDDRLVSTCLQVIADPDALDLVRSLLSHPRWHVRMHAAATLGRIGRADDEALLAPLLADGQWWVRYRAALAISRLPEMDPEGMQRVRDAQTDRFARDVLDHVIAERHMEVDS
ncbi:HEAT repeat domain-containing protein [Agrilutibacter solisilvae]|uniref:HEAT repeat domain-containing protein n=1 Tax=Agrilutibacter solisilvae TaxID=2763317 RepID=A0A975ATF0_9GAMM|nr:HEAT repeat domain-containing protein [Lysobacter solisilvae]QSX79044.1 HEAT repeat domain-containing protein [Lysobacter solisilvae]